MQILPPVESSGIADEHVRGSQEEGLLNRQDHKPKSASPEPRDARAEGGFVLLIVLWWLTLLIFLATQITADARTALLISTNIRGNAVAEAHADGAVNEAIFQILAQRWQADGATRIVPGTQAVSEVRINDEGEKVDPNVAPVVLMQALLRECGAAPKAAAELATAIYDWRSLDLLRSAGAEEASRYRLAGRGYTPPHARFVSSDELGLVLGMTSELLACLGPHLSVYSLSVPSLQTTTDPLVRRALTDAYPYDTPQTVTAVLRETAVIRITAVSHQTGGGRFRRVAVVRVIPVEPDQDFVYKILLWEGSAG
jgi:general secretion pathway protein K